MQLIWLNKVHKKLLPRQSINLPTSPFNATRGRIAFPMLVGGGVMLGLGAFAMLVNGR